MRTLVVIFALAAGCVGKSRSEVTAIIEEARKCVDGDTCVGAGLSDCTCPTAVNSKSVGKVISSLGELDCGGERVQCPALVGPLGCKDGLCKDSTVPDGGVR